MNPRLCTLLLLLTIGVMMAMGQSTDISSRTDAIYVEGKTVKPGSQIVLSVQMKNEAVSVRGFQFDLFLPDRMSFVRDENDKCKVTLSTSRTTGEAGNYFFVANVRSDGALRVLCNAWDGTPFTGTSGEVCTVSVAVDSGAEEGDCAIAFSNIIFTGPDAQRYPVDDVTCLFTISTEEDDILLYGDVNHDGTISIADVMILLRYIIGQP